MLDLENVIHRYCQCCNVKFATALNSTKIYCSQKCKKKFLRNCGRCKKCSKPIHEKFLSYFCSRECANIVDPKNTEIVSKRIHSEVVRMQTKKNLKNAKMAHQQKKADEFFESLKRNKGI